MKADSDLRVKHFNETCKLVGLRGSLDPNLHRLDVIINDHVVMVNALGSHALYIDMWGDGSEQHYERMLSRTRTWHRLNLATSKPAKYFITIEKDAYEPSHL